MRILFTPFDTVLRQSKTQNYVRHPKFEKRAIKEKASEGQAQGRVFLRVSSAWWWKDGTRERVLCEWRELDFGLDWRESEFSVE